MNTAMGTVYKIFDKQAKNGATIHSIKLEGDENYYGTYTNVPACNPGDQVEFQYKINGTFKNVDIKTLKVTGQGQAPQATATAAPSAPYVPKPSARDKYWEDKDTYDKQVRQPLICYQSAHKDAVTIACAALAADIIPLGAKKADKFGVFEALVNKLTDSIYEKYEDATKKLEAGEPITNREERVLGENAQSAPPADEEWPDASDPDLPF